MGFHKVYINEIQKIVSNSPGTTCDLDPIPSALLKNCSDAVLSAMTKIVNNSMNLGEIPSSLKAAQIRPMLKKVNSDSSMLANYCPVSNLCFLSKTLEPVVAKQLSTFHANNNVIDLACTDWGVFAPDSVNLNEHASIITDYITFCMDSTIPMKTVTVYPNSKPWITSDIKNTLKNKQIAYRSKDTHTMKNAHRQLQTEISQAKQRYREKVEK